MKLLMENWRGFLNEENLQEKDPKRKGGNPIPWDSLPNKLKRLIPEPAAGKDYSDVTLPQNIDPADPTSFQSFVNSFAAVEGNYLKPGVPTGSGSDVNTGKGFPEAPGVPPTGDESIYKILHFIFSQPRPTHGEALQKLELANAEAFENSQIMRDITIKLVGKNQPIPLSQQQVVDAHSAGGRDIYDHWDDANFDDGKMVKGGIKIDFSKTKVIQGAGSCVIDPTNNRKDRINVANIIKGALYKKGRGIFNDFINGEIPNGATFGIKAVSNDGKCFIHITSTLSIGGEQALITVGKISSSDKDIQSTLTHEYSVGSDIFEGRNYKTTPYDFKKLLRESIENSGLNLFDEGRSKRPDDVRIKDWKALKTQTTSLSKGDLGRRKRGKIERENWRNAFEKALGLGIPKEKLLDLEKYEIEELIRTTNRMKKEEEPFDIDLSPNTTDLKLRAYDMVIKSIETGGDKTHSILRSRERHFARWDIIRAIRKAAFMKNGFLNALLKKQINHGDKILIKAIVRPFKHPVRSDNQTDAQYENDMVAARKKQLKTPRGLHMYIICKLNIKKGEDIIKVHTVMDTSGLETYKNERNYRRFDVGEVGK